MRRQSTEPIDSPAVARRWLQQREAQWAGGQAYSFAVVRAPGGEGGAVGPDGAATSDAGGDDTVLGSVTVGRVDRVHATGWVSYWTVLPARGRGVATAGCRALATWAFDVLDLYRLELGHRVDNPASCRVATASGFLPEGRQRGKLRYDGVRYDVELHARLASDPDPAAG